MKRSSLVLFSAALFATAGATAVKADVITVATVGTPTISAGVATWTYAVSLVSEQMLTTGLQFGTVYGFNFASNPAVISSSTGLLNTSFNFQLTTLPLTPALGQAANDANAQVCATCYNIRFTYNNSAVIGSTAPNALTDLGTFSVKTTSLVTGLSEYDGQAVGQAGLGGNSHPILVAGVPEPASMALLGAGLVLLGGLRLRRK